MGELVVLVADDEPDMRLLVRTHLRRIPGLVTVEATDGEEALAALADGRFDLLVLDQRMPNRSGIEVARELRDAGSELPIVLFSAYLDLAIEDEAETLGLSTLDKSDIARLPDLIRGMLGL